MAPAKAGNFPYEGPPGPVVECEKRSMSTWAAWEPYKKFCAVKMWFDMRDTPLFVHAAGVPYL